jgi:1-aminocyclopropane-1-carboxylate deaminase/D-cysteine desulfhydrase-like pyridoxal-dependent ACC family enzyme
MKNLFIILLFGLMNCSCTNNSGPSVSNADKASDMNENQSIVEDEKEKISEEISKVCAVISAPDNPGSVNLEVCQDEFSNEAEWKERIDMVVDAKGSDELGNTYGVFVKYRYYSSDNRMVKETSTYEN